MPPPENPWSPAPGEVLTVAEVLARARGLLEEALSWVWVEGEVSNLRVPGSGHAYFTLGDGGAQLRAVCFRSTLRLLGTAPEDGGRVLARGRVTLYEARGDVQLIVEDLEPQGAGLLRLELDARRRRLAAEGLFDASRRRALPLLPRGVGVVTSPTGAALADVLRVLGRRAPGVSVFLAPARVQGEEAPRELAAALALAASHPLVDVVILGRGGGSAEDLSAFNDEDLVRAVASCPVPVVSAVGHEIDDSLTDLAADARAPTPSAAAEIAVREWSRWLDQLCREEAALRAAAARVALSHRGALERVEPRLRPPSGRIDRLRIAVDRRVETLGAGVRERLRRERSRLDRAAGRLGLRSPALRLGRGQEALTRLEERLVAAGAQVVQRRRSGIAALTAGLHALGPRSVLSRGYAIVRGRDGRLVTDASRCAVGDPLMILLARGSVGSRVTSVDPEFPEQESG
ncbi:MAG: exodeoxyribonuclease VII large subunit [Deltaproteobacteria bacterium]|nr:exodeoxyribonuclease VII large subunit [Deltaproteobacteria bacterium]